MIKITTATLFISLFALLFSAISTVFVFYNYFFLERAMIGVEDIQIIPRTDGEFYLELKYKIHNYGKAPARDLNFNIYSISIDDDRLAQMDWSDSIPSVIFPGTSFSFGRNILRPSKNFMGKKIAIIFDFNYQDTKLFSAKNSQLWFKYGVGADSVDYLLESEKKQIERKYQEMRKSVLKENKN